jgi:hypothetical protein
MSRLTRESVEAIEASRLDSARHLAEEESVTVVLKGPRTIVATPKGDIFINMSGNPYMASAGMGDALTGMIAALASRGFPPRTAACAGVFLTGCRRTARAEAPDDAGHRVGRHREHQGGACSTPWTSCAGKSDPASPLRVSGGHLRDRAASGACARPGDVVALTGDLGAGKTRFCKGIGAALGIPPDRVVSPTFTIVMEHDGNPPLVHVDVYG